MYLDETQCVPSKRSLLKAKWPEPIWNLSTHRSCIHNEQRALLGRVIRFTQHPDLGAVTLMREALMDIVKDLPLPIPMLDYHSLIASFVPSRRKRYMKVKESLLDTPLIYKDEFIKSFVKSEKLLIEEKDGDPRMIQARSFRFNLELAKYTKPIEASLYALKDPHYLNMGIPVPIVAKGRNMVQRAQDLRRMWDLMDNPVAMSLDLSRWDMHVDVELIKTMHQMYLYQMPDLHLEHLLRAQLDNRCRTEGGIKYKVAGCVMSGDMTTALGNCVAVLAILLSYRDTLDRLAGTIDSGLQDEICPKFARVAVPLLQRCEGIKGRSIKSQMMFYDDGDDHVMMVEKAILPVVEKTIEVWWGLMGHELKVEGNVDAFHQILFCQHKPHLTAKGWVMMPDPRKVLATSTVISSKYQNNPRSYLATIARARLLLHHGLPMLDPFFRQLTRQLKGQPCLGQAERRHALTGVDMLMNKMDIKVEEFKEPPQVDITPESRIMCAEQWGIEVDRQVFLEQFHLTMPKVRARMRVEHPIKTEVLSIIPI